MSSDNQDLKKLIFFTDFCTPFAVCFFQKNLDTMEPRPSFCKKKIPLRCHSVPSIFHSNLFVMINTFIGPM